MAIEKAVREVSLPGLRHLGSGKVGEIYEADDRILIVRTDRISAFDVVMRQGIPGRGIVLTQLSDFWFQRLEAVCPHHLVTTDVEAMPAPVREQADVLRGRTMFVRKVDIVPVECVVRGYLAGSGWKEYRKSRTVCGVGLPEGLVESDRLPEPIFTPTTKAHEGHDEPMTYGEVEEAVGKETAARLRELSFRLYTAGAEYAAARGILLADTKFEFGFLGGELILADECLTPDSSRYWDAGDYEPGRSQDSFDKQIVRDYLETLDWDKTPPPPDLPEGVIARAAARYEEIAARLMR
jgi:phosphoribosylaminoimidazole-succinocarboxamide synthase